MKEFEFLEWYVCFPVFIKVLNDYFEYKLSAVVCQKIKSVLTLL